MNLPNFQKEDKEHLDYLNEELDYFIQSYKRDLSRPGANLELLREIIETLKTQYQEAVNDFERRYTTVNQSLCTWHPGNTEPEGKVTGTSDISATDEQSGLGNS